MPTLHERAQNGGGKAADPTPLRRLLFLLSSPLLAPAAQRRAAQTAPAIAAVLVYIGALANGFAYDDLPVVRDNDWVRHGLVLTQALTLPYWPNGALYRPLTSFSYGVDWLLGGGRPLLFHAVNIAWYALGTALVVRVALRWWPPLAAALAGLVFAIHPVHVESVANVVGRAELLAGAGLLGIALIVSAPRPLTRARLLGVGVLAALALAAKETGAVAPLVAWATTRMRTDARPGDARRATVAALVGVALLIAQRAIVLGTIAGDTPHAAFIVGTHAQSLALALATLPRAAALLFIPQLPRLDYSPTTAALVHPALPLVVLGAAMVVAAGYVLVLHARRPSPWSWAAVFSIATFAPVSNLVIHTGVVLADRTLYAPSVGACLLIGAALAALLARRTPLPAPRFLLAASPLAAGIAAALLVAGATYTLRTIPVWHDNQTAFTAMRDRTPSSYRGYYLLGKERRAQGPSADAQQDYRTAITLFDGDPGLLYDAGANALGLGDTTDALSWLAAAVDRSPQQRRARTALILLHVQRHEPAPARALLERGLALEPDQHLWRKILDSLNHSPAAPSVGGVSLPAAHRPLPAVRPTHTS